MAFRNLMMHSLMASWVCAVLIPDLTLASALCKDSILAVHIQREARGGGWGLGGFGLQKGEALHQHLLNNTLQRQELT